MKLFISQPMNGLSNEEIERVRGEIVEDVRERYPTHDIDVIDSFFKNAPHDAAPLWFLGESIKLLSLADIVYFGEGWEKARGCKIEHDAAVAYGLEVIYE